MSIENLLNLRKEADCYKNVHIDMIIKFIHRNLDLDKYKGMLYTSYTKLQIKNDINKFLKSITGNIIKDYLINKIEFVQTAPGVGNILIEITIKPRGVLESLDIRLEV